jgi:hypothetical protein|nr:MAG TPA: hypothetical protein [Caudoviricetes sp.]
MINYPYSPAELKIIIDIANKNEIPITFYYNNGNPKVNIHSRQDFKKLFSFSHLGVNSYVPFSTEKYIDCFNELSQLLKPFMIKLKEVGIEK